MSTRGKQSQFHPNTRYIITLTENAMWLKSPKGIQMFWDIGSFRPDPRYFLKSRQKYTAGIQFDQENLLEGNLITFPRILTVMIGKSKKEIFINVR